MFKKPIPGGGVGRDEVGEVVHVEGVGVAQQAVAHVVRRRRTEPAVGSQVEG